MVLGISEALSVWAVSDDAVPRGAVGMLRGRPRTRNKAGADPTGRICVNAWWTRQERPPAVQ